MQRRFNLKENNNRQLGHNSFYSYTPLFKVAREMLSSNLALPYATIDASPGLHHSDLFHINGLI